MQYGVCHLDVSINDMLPCLVFQHCTLSPLPAYEPAFDWDNERSLIFGQRLPESLPATHSRFALSCTLKHYISLLLFALLTLGNLCYYLLVTCYNLISTACSGLKITVKVLSLSFQTGLVGEQKYYFYVFVPTLLNCNIFSFVLRSMMTDLPFGNVSCAEPFGGTICLYNRDRREKLSEDFYFHILPTEMQDVRSNVYYSLPGQYFYPLKFCY